MSRMMLCYMPFSDLSCHLNLIQKFFMKNYKSKTHFFVGNYSAYTFWIRRIPDHWSGFYYSKPTGHPELEISSYPSLWLCLPLLCLGPAFMQCIFHVWKSILYSFPLGIWEYTYLCMLTLPFILCFLPILVPFNTYHRDPILVQQEVFIRALFHK